MNWELKVGDTIRRTDLIKQYGGSRQGGICPSRKTPNVLICGGVGAGCEAGDA
jgi:hypothetical protein